MNMAKAAFFDTQASAEWANQSYGSTEFRRLDRLFASADIRPGARIVQPGCGTGRLTQLLSEKVGRTGLVTAFDISSGMVASCRDRTASLPNVQVLVVSLEEFTPVAGGYDFAICHNVFPHFDDKAAAVRCLAQALRPRGRLIIHHFLSSDAINDIHRKAHDSIREDMMPSQETMSEMISAVGFEIESYADDGHGYLLVAILAASRG